MPTTMPKPLMVGNRKRPIVGKAPAVRVPAPNFGWEEMMDVQRGQIRKREFKPLGRLEAIFLGDNAIPNPSPDNPLVGRWTSDGHPMLPALDWLDKGPGIGLTADEKDILVISEMIHPPDLVDPDWKRKLGPVKKNENGIPMLEKPATIPQSLLHRCWTGPDCKWVKRGDKWVPTGDWFFAGKDGGEYMVFQPVVSIVFMMAGRVGMGIIKCKADTSGRHTMLLYERKRQEGFIMFGEKDLDFLK